MSAAENIETLLRRDRFFISYRRVTCERAAIALYDVLADKFGAETVFLDRKDIPPGTLFPKYIDYELSRSCAVLALLDPQWLHVAAAAGPWAGKRRLDDPEDYVCREIQLGLDHGIRVYPLLLGETTMPAARELPPRIRNFAYCHALPLPALPDDISCRELVQHLENVRSDPFLDNHLQDDYVHVHVSFHHFTGEEPEWKNLNCQHFNRFQLLLDEIYFVADGKLPMYGYGAVWVLRVAETGTIIEHLKMKEGTQLGQKMVDFRLLSEVGIRPGMRLEVVPCTIEQSQAANTV